MLFQSCLNWKSICWSSKIPSKRPWFSVGHNEKHHWWRGWVHHQSKESRKLGTSQPLWKNSGIPQTISRSTYLKKNFEKSHERGWNIKEESLDSKSSCKKRAQFVVVWRANSFFGQQDKQSTNWKSSCFCRWNCFYYKRLLESGMVQLIYQYRDWR